MNYKHGLTNQIKRCVICSNEFVAKKDYASRSQSYCSKKCYGLSLIKWKVCKQCGTKFSKSPNKLFCSIKCLIDSQRGIKRGPNQFKEGNPNYQLRSWICKNCSKEFKSRGVFKNRIPKYCSRQCASVGRIGLNNGEKCHLWKGGISKINRTERENIMSSVEYKEWRRKVFKRDGYICLECKEPDKRILAHHIKEFSKYPNLRFEVSNGLTLCKNCHSKEHRKD